MLVKMLTNVAGKPAYYAGQEVDLDPRVAKVWIEEGYCAPVPTEAAATAKR